MGVMEGMETMEGMEIMENIEIMDGLNYGNMEKILGYCCLSYT